MRTVRLRGGPLAGWQVRLAEPLPRLLAVATVHTGAGTWPAGAAPTMVAPIIAATTAPRPGWGRYWLRDGAVYVWEGRCDAPLA